MNDFPLSVRLEGIQDEIQDEASRWSSLLDNMASQANPEAKEAKDLAAKAKRTEKELYTRLNNYNRTGDYSYIINIVRDAEDCDEMAAKADRLARKVKPYVNHTNKQIKAFQDAILRVDGAHLISSGYLTADTSIDEQFIFEHVIGVPDKMMNPTEATLDSLATAVLTNYFADNPTPTVTVHQYQKDKKCWYISLSDETHYYLSAVKCDNGEYEYEYQEADNSLSLPTISSEKKKSKADNVDKFLDDYEKFVDSYAKTYKKLYKRSLESDLSAITDLQKLSIRAAKFAERYESLDEDISSEQLQRYNEITFKLTEAITDAMTDE